MANINDLFPSKFLKAHELKGTSPTVTIARVGVEQVRGRQKVDTKAVLYFTGKTKGMLLNKTNAQSVAQIAKSALTEQWTGVAITLYATTATFGPDVHDVIRIKAPASGVATSNEKAKQEARPPSPPQSAIRNSPIRQSMPPIWTDELEIDLQDAGGRR